MVLCPQRRDLFASGLDRKIGDKIAAAAAIPQGQNWLKKAQTASGAGLHGMWPPENSHHVTG